MIVMNKEKYIKIVMKNLGCSKQQKLKIKADLESDFETALKMGESLEDIMHRMGEPQELAWEFNDNLGVTQKKSHKKLILSVFIGIVCVLIAGFFYIRSQIPKTNPIGTSGIFQESQLEEWSIQTIQKMDDYQYIYDMSVPQMKKALTKEKWQDALNQLGELGSFKIITSQYYAEVSQNKEILAVGEVVALYDKRSVTYTLTFDKTGHLAGVYMK